MIRSVTAKINFCAGLSFILLLGSCSLPQSKIAQTKNSQTLRAVAADLDFIPSNLIVSRHAFLGWRFSQDHTRSEIDPTKLNAKTIDCEDKNLYPTDPLMTKKEYHLGYSGKFNFNLLQKDQPGCMIGGLTLIKGVYPCFSSDTLRHVIISDTYQDRCGNFYRGFSQVVYLKKEENMGTLFSRGRTMYPNPKSEIPNDFVFGETYSVQASDLFLVAALFEKDLPKIRKDREFALQGEFVFNGQTLLFSLKNSAH